MIVSNVRRQFGPVEGLHGNPHGLDIASTDGRWVLAVAVAGSSMVFLDATVVNVALPDIGRDFGAGMSELQWVLNSYLLALASLILLGGSLGDRFGRVKIFLAGIAVFSAASGLCAAAPTIGFLIGARLVQGVGAALLTPGSLALIETCMRPAQRARAIGIWSGLSGVASAVGPLVGGYLVGAISWRAVFLINLPIGAVVAWAAVRHIPETRDFTATGRLDYLGAALLALGLIAITFTLIEAPGGASATDVALVAALGVIALTAFVWQEQRRPNPILPFEIFRSRQFSAANAVTFVIYAGLGGFFFLFVSFLQIFARLLTGRGGRGLAAGDRAFARLLRVVGRARAADRRPRPARRRLPRHRRGAPSDDDDFTWRRLPHQRAPPDRHLRGGADAGRRPGTAVALAAADLKRAGIASGVNNAVARVAGLLAVAALPILAGISGQGFYEPVKMTTGFHIAMAICAALAAGGGVLAWFTITSPVSTSPSPIDLDLPLSDRFSCPLGEPNLCSGPVGGSDPSPEDSRVSQR